MENRIKKVIVDVLMVDQSMITDKSSPETIDEWDSLRQMNIIIALEEEFNILLSDEDVIEMLNVKLINSIIKDRIS